MLPYCTLCRNPASGGPCKWGPFLNQPWEATHPFGRNVARRSSSRSIPLLSPGPPSGLSGPGPFRIAALELARKLGFDAGFSKGTYPHHLATFIVRELAARTAAG